MWNTNKPLLLLLLLLSLLYLLLLFCLINQLTIDLLL